MLIQKREIKISNALAGAGAGVGAAGAGGSVEAGLNRVVVGPYINGGFGERPPKMHEQTMNCRELTIFSFCFDYI